MTRTTRSIPLPLDATIPEPPTVVRNVDRRPDPQVRIDRSTTRRDRSESRVLAVRSSDARVEDVNPVTAFSTSRSLGRINVAAVGVALAACTAAAFDFAHFASGWAVGVPTLVLGTFWAHLLRRKSTVGNSGLRWGWLASIPLAALNAGLACAALFLTEEHGGDVAGPIVGGLIAGATFGIFIWAPALVATLVCFGLPMAWAERLASRGLSGTERGERILGAACTVLGAGALAATALAPPRPEYLDPDGGGIFTQSGALFDSGHRFAQVLACVGMALGACAFALAHLRTRRRAEFVAQVEAGAVPKFRVDTSPEGKVLMRVDARGAGAYRVADYEEEICRLDAEGEAIEVREEALLAARTP